MLGTLNAAQIDHVLHGEVMGRLGCYTDGRVYIVPVSYVYDGEFVYGHSSDGLKMQMLRANPKVCFQVDRVENLANWRSVIVWGTVQEITGADAEGALDLFLDRMTPLITSETALSPRVSALGGQSADVTGEHANIYRIKLTERSGRYEKR